MNAVILLLKYFAIVSYLNIDVCRKAAFEYP